MLNKVIIVLPKLSSYQYKLDDEKRRLEKVILDEFKRVSDSGAKIYCIAEDMLAVRILGVYSEWITWITTLGSSDSNFIKTAVDDYPPLYNSIKKELAKQSYIKGALERYKVKKNTESKDQLEIRGARLTVLNNRIRYVANRVVNDFNHIIYIDANNNFCSEPKPVVGDGKLIVHVNINTGLTLYTYGGVPINKDAYEDIVRSVM